MEAQPRLFGLGAIAVNLRWIEGLVNPLSGPLLVLGLGIALVDLLTDGALTASTPALLYVWAISQAAGVDAQLVGSFARARHALRRGHHWSLVGLLLLGAVLAYVGWIAAQVFATAQAEHITTMQALAQLGFDRTAWIVQRSALSVFLVCLSGWTRYIAPAKPEASLEDERARLERELTLEPLRQRARAQKAVGAAQLGRQMVAAARGKDVPPTVSLDRPPTGGGSPALARAQGDNILQLDDQRTARKRRGVRTPRKRAGASASVEHKARAVWQPEMSVEALQVAAGISRGSAQKYHAKLRAQDDATYGELAQ